MSPAAANWPVLAIKRQALKCELRTRPFHLTTKLSSGGSASETSGKRRCPIVVIGAGNPLMGDEGIGTRVVRECSAASADIPDIEFVDIGTPGLSLLHVIAGRQAVILVDCAKMGEEPGTIRRFTPDEVRSVKAVAGASLHEADLFRVIELSGLLGEAPKHIIIFGIEPADIRPGDALSPQLEAGLSGYQSIVMKELNRL